MQPPAFFLSAVCLYACLFLRTKIPAGLPTKWTPKGRTEEKRRKGNPTEDQSCKQGSYVESEEMMLQPCDVRQQAWRAWRDARRESRRYAFARLRDACALGVPDFMDAWKSRMIELGPDEPDTDMPDFSDKHE